MNQGFYLTVMMGPFNATPVPEAVIEALISVQVTTTVGQQGGFQMKFTFGKRSLLAQLQAGGFFDPRRRVIIAVTVNGTTEVLMDGIITKQDLTPGNAAGKSTFTVTGIDLTALMDFIDLTGVPFPAMPDALRVAAILSKYLVLGVVPVVIPTPIASVPNPKDKIPKQHGTDYAYIQSLCSQTGAVFYLDPGPAPGMSIAYWGPDITKLFGGVQPALSIDLDAGTNVDSLNFSYDGTVARDFVLLIMDKDDKVPVPVPIPSLDLLMLLQGARPPTVLKVEQLGPYARDDSSEAALAALAALRGSADVVTGTGGQLDVLRYGRVLKARQLCAVRGASEYFDGLYHVNSVTHDIKRGEYKQSFSLARRGVGTSISAVAV